MVDIFLVNKWTGY